MKQSQEHGSHAGRRARQTAALLTALVLLAPSMALAGRKREKRRLPESNASTTHRPMRGSKAADPAVEAGVEALRAAFGADTDKALDRRVGPDGAYLSRSTSGYVQALVAPLDRAYQVARPGGDGSPDALARTFLQEHRVAFGISRMGTSLDTRQVRKSGARSFVRLEQRFAGIPVFGAGAVVQVEPSGGISFALVDLARDDARLFAPGFPTRPTVMAETARDLARDALPPGTSPMDLVASTPELMIFEPSVIGDAGPTRLVWHVRLVSASADVNEVVLVDAEAPGIAFHYSDRRDAKNRSIYDGNNVPASPGTLVRSEGGGASGVVDADLAYEYLGDTYDFYFTSFGRDSYDDAGAALVARVRYCETASPCPETNAWWDPDASEMLFGDGYAAADDVVAHELTHAVTTNESNLIYWGESGAIDEGMSDIFGEIVDLTNTGGTDTPEVRWHIGEDLPIGAIRNMSDPTIFGDPDRRLSPNWYTGSEDNRGVHTNCGVADKLAFLLADGGSFNGEDVVAIGLEDVAALFYEAQVNLLTPASDYFDLYAVLRQAASNVTLSPEEREALERASRAVEIAVPGNVQTVYQDDFEGSFPGSWVSSDDSAAGAQWGLSSHRSASGASSLYCAGDGVSAPAPGTTYLPDMDTWIVYGPFDLSSTNEAWAEFDLFLDIEYVYDDVFWGVSTDGTTFDGYAISPAPDGYTTGVDGTPGWAHELFNFQEMTSPAIVGASQVWLAFNFTSDDIVQYEGAYIDNVVIKKAPSGSPFGSFDTPADGVTGVTGAIPVTGWALDDSEVTKVEIHRDPVTGETPGPNGKVYLGDATFVPGARPDVDTAYPGYPFSYQAGWGLMVLTNMLPSSGNGTFTLYAYATDDQGQTSLLGSKTITCDNANATLPFGTIDTPGQGATVSGTVVNFGWALTPLPGTIPTDGSTIVVYVDGAPLGNPVYNNYRDDIATLFPGYNNSDGAIGYYVLDTTTYANGIHTIQWVATDDQGRASGLGSRYFWIDN